MIFDHELKGSGLHFLVEFWGETTLETSARPLRVLGGGQEDRPLDGVVPLAAQVKGRDPGFGFHPRVGRCPSKGARSRFWLSSTGGPTG